MNILRMMEPYPQTILVVQRVDRPENMTVLLVTRSG